MTISIAKGVTATSASTDPASSTTAGIVELATDTEAKAVTSQTLATTPGNLAAVFAEPPALGSTTPAAVRATEIDVATGTITASNPVLDATQTWNNAGVAFTAAKVNVTDTASAVASRLLDLQVGNNSLFTVQKDGQLITGRYATVGFYGMRFDPSSGILTLSRSADGGVTITVNAGANSLSVGTLVIGSDTFLTRDAANILAQRNGANAQESRLYGTYTSATDYERLTLKAVTTSDFRIIPEAGGTGTLRGLQVGTSSGKLGFFGTTAVTKPTALTAADASTVDSTYGAEESTVINNLRTRLNELETKLKALGLLT